jgi:outer membrane protein assembly factor BamB
MSLPPPPPTSLTPAPHSTDVTGIKGTALGRHTLYFYTWSGPGLYSVALASGRVRWQFPLNNWFAYWRKDIDLPPSASFAAAGESGGGAAFAAAAGPPARVYGLRSKSGGGGQQWEWKADAPGAALVDVAGPDMCAPALRRAARAGGGGGGGGSGSSSGGSDNHSGGASGADCVGADARTAAGVLYLALSLPSAGGSWLVALALADGTALWASEAVPGVAFGRVEIDGPRLLVEDAAAGQLLAYDAADGRLLWHWKGVFCPTPSPLQRVYQSAGRRQGAAAEAAEAAEDPAPGLSRRRHHHSGGSGGGGGSGGLAGGVLLLARACGGMDTLTALDSGSGKELWSGLPAPGDGGRLLPGCSWAEVADGTAYVGCNCIEQSGEQEEDEHPAACLFALELATGRRLWRRVVELEAGGGAGFDPDAQAWGQAPVALRGARGVVAFVTNATVLGADAVSGKLLWRAPLAAGEWVAPWQAAAEGWAEPAHKGVGGGGGGDPGGGRDAGGGGSDAGGGGSSGGGAGGRATPLLLLHTLRGAGNKTTVYAMDGESGRAVWARGFNGSMPQPASPGDGGVAPLALGPRVMVETCRRGRCCLRGLDASNGKSAWRGICLDAARGTDPTNPRAQFAIWVVTLVTIASIAALILGAALLYLSRWADERALLSGDGGGGSDGHESEPLLAPGVRRVGVGAGAGAAPAGAGAAGAAGDGPRLSLFARAGGAATTVLGGPPSPDSLAGAAYAGAGGEAGGAAAAGNGVGSGISGALGRLFGGRERVQPRSAMRAGAAGPGAAGAPADPEELPPAARPRNVAAWRQGD